MAEKKKYYWLRVKRDFFKRHDITIIEAMENGKDYILFYLKLLCESVDHEGNLRFSEEIPYNDKMLSTITNTNIDIVRSAIEVFTKLGMMDILDDGTYYMSGVEKMIGCMEQDEHTRESTRKRVQAFRERKKLKAIEESEEENTTEVLPKRYSNVTCNGEIEIEKEKEYKRISKDILCPTQDVERAIDEWNNLPEPITKVHKMSPTSKRYKMLKARIKEYGIEMVIDAIRKVYDSDFLRQSTWFNFDWFVCPNNFIKVSDGNYDNKNSKTTPQYRTMPKEKWDSYMWNAAIKDGYVTSEDYTEWRASGNVII
jgi:predicted phage replisome organizer